MTILKTPPKAVLRKTFGKTVTLNKYSFSDGTDAYGQKTKSLASTYSLKAEIQEFTAEDLMFLPPGIVNQGDAYGFFLADYFKKGKTITISPEDEIVWNSKTWRIDTIEDFYFGKHLWYKRALLRRVV